MDVINAEVILAAITDVGTLLSIPSHVLLSTAPITRSQAHAHTHTHVHKYIYIHTDSKRKTDER